jgi:hypothetical protein
MPATFVPISIPDAATYTVKARDTGLRHYLPDLTADIVITLPTPKAGLWFEFIYVGDAADAQDWLIDTTSNTYYFKGGLVFMDQDGDVLAPIDGDGNSNSKLTILTPEPGTKVLVECANGTNWNLSGYVLSATIPSFADQ